VIHLIFNPVFGMMNIPPCPHEGCGWFMPDLSCPAHGNYGFTYLAVRRGPVTWVKTVLDIPYEPLPDNPGRT
jgi:hypothetical protein